ncbi:unnamed protein product, partial [Heterosigma akashiwo]
MKSRRRPSDSKELLNEKNNVAEILPGRLYYCTLSQAPNASLYTDCNFFTTDNTLQYFNFFLDFGPLNLSQLYRFCMLLNRKLADEHLKGQKIVYYSGTHGHKRANSVCLLASWSVIFQNQSPDEAFRPFQNHHPRFPYFHDASPVVCTYNLSILDCLMGLSKARQLGFFDFRKFDPQEYEYYEEVENGDLNWLADGKFIAFAGPQEKKFGALPNYRLTPPEYYIPYFRKGNVKLVVRLNKKYYDENKFINAGIDHLHLYYLDGSVPPKATLDQFLAACERYMDGAIAVHCKAGLGRTGTCIGCYMMKHYRMTAAEVIGWLRIVRPGSIIGPQQHYMKEMEGAMWQEGEAFRWPGG